MTKKHTNFIKAIKNIGVGFGISFMGSIPLGYVNVVGYELYTAKGFISLLPFLGGVIAEEAVVIYLTLAFAEKLSKGGRLVKAMEIFSIAFLLGLSAYFYFRHSEPGQPSGPAYLSYAPFLAGAVLNAVNFMQFPFWTGWNLYFVSNSYIFIDDKKRYLYIVSALVGTFAGMLLFILGLHYLADSITGLSHYLMTLIVPSIFLALAIFQGYKFYRKYHLHKKSRKPRT
jgi:hypothetical protein